MSRTRLLLFLLCFTATASFARAGDADDEWAVITAMDAGPKKSAASREEAQLIARNYLSLQRDKLEIFLLKYPRDPRDFEAHERLASIWAAEGNLDGNPALVEQALTELDKLEKTPGLSPEKQANAGFLRASISMQNQQGNPAHVRDAVVRCARDFASRYPDDRRAPRLLVEAATLCDDIPDLKKSLLNQALETTHEDALKRRIADDFKRINALGEPLALRFTSIQGGTVDLAALRGNVVVVIFWSSQSPQSLIWLRDFRIAYEKWPKGSVKVITVNLDEHREAMEQRLQDLPPDWPTYFDGKGWDSALPRALGINALPSVWIIGKKGVVRTINAKANYADWVHRLSAE